MTFGIGSTGFRLYYIERATARLIWLLLLRAVPIPMSLLSTMVASSGGRLLLFLLLQLLLLLSLFLLLGR